MLSPNFPIGVIVFPDATSFMKKQMLPDDDKNATSPFLNSDFALSVPESTFVSKYKILFPKRWALPSNGKDLIMIPTVRGDKWRFRSHEIFVLPRISKISCFLETEDVLNSYFKMIRLYNVLRKFWYLPDVEEAPLLDVPETEVLETPESEESDLLPEVNAGLNKALNTYRKIIEKKGGLEPLSEKDQENLEKRIREIESREIVEKIEEHEPKEIPCEKGKITIGPPTLTRFEKARIMGARALQLSLGAPPFIPIPKTARISLDIAMEELEQRVIPITIRRVLPNGDFQNIPIDYFEK